jgi:hypothetical protein
MSRRVDDPSKGESEPLIELRPDGQKVVDQVVPPAVIKAARLLVPEGSLHQPILVEPNGVG